MTLSGLIPPLTILGFLLAAVYGYKGKKPAVAVVLSLIIGGLLLLQTSLMVRSGWQVSLHESLLVALALMQGCYLITALSAKTMWRLSLLTQPVLGLVYGIAWLVPSPTDVFLSFTPLLAAHIGFALIGYGLLTMAAFAAFAVYTREAYLKAHSASGFSTRLPVLEAADKGQFTALGLGAASLAVALVAGAMYQHDISGSWFVLSIKTLFTYITFVAILALLAARRLWGTRGARAAKRIMLTYTLLLVAFLSSKLALIVPQ